MAGYRFWTRYGAVLLATLLIVQAGNAQEKCLCKIYSLADVGDDGKLGKWVAETIPEMIQPASWKQADAKLSYFGPSKILVVNNTPAVHAQVEEFLSSLRKAMPQQKRQDGQIVPAQFVPEDAPRTANVVQSGPNGYPVPMSPVGPKHLFHFIIRYEGEGIIDSNVSKFAKALIEANKDSVSAQSASYVFPQPTMGPVTNAPMTIRATSDGPTTSPRPLGPQMPPADAPRPSSGPPLSAPSSIPAPPPYPLAPVPVTSGWRVP